MHVLCPHCQGPIELIDLRAQELVCPSCGSSFQLEHSTTDWRSRSGERRLGKFAILSELGAGAFGTVHKARDTELDRIVALKVPRTGNLSSQEDQDRFLREARSAAQLRHANIVPLYEVGQAEGLPYLVSAYVQGVTLADLLTARRPSPREAAELIAAVADALQYAHEQGVIHRDVKPSNIMVGDEGTPYLMDFGLAKREAGEVTMTVEGQVLGTPAYMSPEQARGEGHSVDGRSDVYSLGVILYRLLTGELPFRGNPRMLLHQVLHDEPRSPRSLNDRIPRDLETICLRAMAKEPGRRYQSARVFGEDLRRFLKGEPIQARSTGAWLRAALWARRRPAVAGLLLASAVGTLALVGLGVGLFFNARLRVALDQTERAQAAEKEQRRTAELLKSLHQVGMVHAGWRDGNLAQAERLLEACPPHQRHWEWHYLRRLCHADLFTFTGHIGAVTDAMFSPEGTRIASGGADRLVKLWDARTGEVIRQFPGHTDHIRCVTFSPDGTRLASGSMDGTAIIWDLGSGQLIYKLKHDGFVTHVAFSPDGARLASASRDETVRIWNLHTGQEKHRVTSPKNRVVGVAFSPDGTLLAGGHFEHGVTLWNAATLVTIATFEGHSNFVYRVAFSPDGTCLASASGDRTIRLWDVRAARTGKMNKSLLTLKSHTSMVWDVAFSPDGARLASACADGIVRVWDAKSGEEIRDLKGHTSGVNSVAFSADGARLVSAGNDGTVKIWAAATEFDSLSIQGGNGLVAFSPDSAQFASTDRDRLVRLFDLTTGQLVRTFQSRANARSNLAFSPDGSLLASGGEGRTIAVWEVKTGRQSFVLPGQPEEVRGVTFSSDGKLLAAVCTDQSVTVWDVTTQRDVFHHYESQQGLDYREPFGIVFSPDGKRLAAGSGDGTVRVWDANTGRDVFRLSGHAAQVRGVAFSPDGRLLASSAEPGGGAAGSGDVKLWDMTTGGEGRSLSGHTFPVRCLAFSPDGKRLATASMDQTAKLWDVETGLEVMTLRGHDISVWTVAFTPDGTRLATASMDGRVRTWDARPWTPDAAFEHEALGLLAFLFSKPLCQADVLTYLNQSPTIRPQARQLALALVKRYGEERNPERYHEASWDILRQRYCNAYQYRYALSQAETARRLAPHQSKYLTTLGAAQYRASHYAQARNTLAQADLLHRTDAARLALLARQFPQAVMILWQSQQSCEAVPANLAFLAMTHHQLGQKELAQATLARLREITEKPEWAKDKEIQGFLREAERLLGGEAAVPKR